MKVAWATDLHLQFPDSNTIDKFFERVNNSGADILLISGDIADGNSIEYWLTKIDKNINIPIYFVLGNHDFYHSSISNISKLVSKICKTSEKLTWLSETNYIPIENTALIGHEGWYDARNGNMYGIKLNDFMYIGDLLPFSSDLGLLSKKCQEIAMISTNHFKHSLKSAFKKFDNVMLVTHVPPFMEATWHKGKRSDPKFLPWFSSKKTGEVLLNIMKSNVNKRLTILCGHTHSFALVDMLPNLKVIVSKSEYYYPDIYGVINVS